MIKKIAIGGILPILLMTGCSSLAAESAKENAGGVRSGIYVPPKIPLKESERALGVRVDYGSNGSIESLAQYAKLVVVGKFTKFLGDGDDASRYRMGGYPGMATDLWTFEVSDTIFGEPVSELNIVRFDVETIDSETVALEEGLEAMLMLTREVNGARIVLGGDLGLFVIDDDGRFLRPESQNVLTKYATLDLAREFFGR